MSPGLLCRNIQINIHTEIMLFFTTVKLDMSHQGKDIREGCSQTGCPRVSK